MFFTYLFTIILLGFAFHLLLAIIAIPVMAFANFFSKNDPDDKVHLTATAINQGTIAVLYSGYIAVITVIFTVSDAVSVTWPYFVAGIVWVFMTLGSHAATQAEQREYGLWQTPEQQANATGAAIGVLLSLLAFPIFVKWPQLVFAVPGAEWFIASSFTFGLWLGGFWIVRVLLFISVAGYVMNAGFMALFAGAMLLMFLWSRVTGGSDATGSGESAA